MNREQSINKEVLAFVQSNTKTVEIYTLLFIVACGVFVFLLLPDWQVTPAVKVAMLGCVVIMALAGAEFLAWSGRQRTLKLWIIAATANLAALAVGLFMFGGVHHVATVLLAIVLMVGLRRLCHQQIKRGLNMIEALILGVLIAIVAEGGEAALTAAETLPVVGEFASWFAGLVGPHLQPGIIANLIYGSMAAQVVIIPYAAILYALSYAITKFEKLRGERRPD